MQNKIINLNISLILEYSMVFISPFILFFIYTEKKRQEIQVRREMSYQTIFDCITHVEQTDLEFLPCHLMDI